MFESTPTIFIVATVMWIIHGFVLDVLVICVLPFLSSEKSDAERADKFPWALGGYSGYPLVPNLAPTHRRFMTENAAYAIVRVAPVFFTTNQPILLLAVISYLVEAVTIAWEISSYSAPGNAMLPQTLMGVFSSVVTYASTKNPDGFIVNEDEHVLMTMQACSALTWVCWVSVV